MKNLFTKIDRIRLPDIVTVGLLAGSLSFTFMLGLASSDYLFDKKAKKLYKQSFEGDELKYNNGNSVTSDKIIQWINDYNKLK